MAQYASIFTPATAPLTLAVLVLPQASILEVASTLDPMRSANRHLGSTAYNWRILSPDGGPVPLTCGIELPASGTIEQATGADALVVIAGFKQTQGATRPLIAALRRAAPRFAMIGGIDAGPWVLARAGLLDGYKATVHWEDFEDMAAAHPNTTLLPDRYVIDRNRFTAGGAAPAHDLMLHLIAQRQGAALARQVAASFLTTPQPASNPQQVASGPHIDPRIANALTRWEARLDSPEPMAATARALGLSPRRLETLFQSALGQSPAAYALTLRLAAARRLVTDTHHPLAEIALRCGFSSQSTLTRAFTRAFGHPPSTLRKSR
ncbi:transcriptional regulator, AraC family with amidase-like domain [Pseudorhodobacter antarcticus]|uniref:Transcriptional regulator, AraC family with amidase-like domain n=1 Tax=Pseudorhodobacter antarcticus TaxID=1077947 RepID=A0A1H8B819_9RHOB|nr:GlxA family transcriptional regulator [Pseudorhodobacter antarcticus]SEM78923.1 transcriptional regulator, AraC family with amidase-like domain [Pseudorhodobacter antarcticus]